jgi:hypothetical protein
MSKETVMPFPPKATEGPDAPPRFAKKAAKKRVGKSSRKGGVAPIQKSMLQSGRSLAGGRR